MAEVQSLDKPKWIRSCSHLADHFTHGIFEKYGDSDEIRLTFDRYDLPSSRHAIFRHARKRHRNQDPVYYRITSSTHIAKLTVKKLLSQSNIQKSDLAKYFAQKTVEYAEQNRNPGGGNVRL